jgi:hypothetical protein
MTCKRCRQKPAYKCRNCGDLICGTHKKQDGGVCSCTDQKGDPGIYVRLPKMEQAVQYLSDGRVLKAWRVKAETIGRSRWLRTWAETAGEAKAKVTQQGFSVTEVKPAPPII